MLQLVCEVQDQLRHAHTQLAQLQWQGMRQSGPARDVQETLVRGMDGNHEPEVSTAKHSAAGLHLDDAAVKSKWLHDAQQCVVPRQAMDAEHIGQNENGQDDDHFQSQSSLHLGLARSIADKLDL